MQDLGDSVDLEPAVMIMLLRFNKKLSSHDYYRVEETLRVGLSGLILNSAIWRVTDPVSRKPQVSETGAR